MVQVGSYPVGVQFSFIFVSSESTERNFQGLVLEEADLRFTRASSNCASVSFTMLYSDWCVF